MKMVHKITGEAKDSYWVAEHLKPRWSGTLVFDGKVIKIYDWFAKRFKGLPKDEYRAMHRKTWLCGKDYDTGDLPHYSVADSENKIDLVMYFKQLKKNGYILRNLVSDGNLLILESARFVYGDDFVFQLCARHFLEEMRRIMVEREDEKNISLTEGLLQWIKNIIEAKNRYQAKRFLISLNNHRYLFESDVQRWILLQLKDKIKDLTAYLRHPERNIPYTTNDIENVFKQLNLRLKSIGRFMKIRYANNYLNAWALMRRFTPFTDCRKGRKHRNGKAPLEIAGCDIKRLDYLNL